MRYLITGAAGFIGLHRVPHVSTLDPLIGYEPYRSIEEILAAVTELARNGFGR